MGVISKIQWNTDWCRTTILSRVIKGEVGYTGIHVGRRLLHGC